MAASTQHKETILITGGAGFIGTHLCRKLLGLGHEVISLDLKGTPITAVSGVRYIQGDARDQTTIARILGPRNVTTVYHLAATVSVPICQNDPIQSYSHNVGATLSVLESCREELARRKSIGDMRSLKIAFASSAALYGDLGNHGRPLSEKQTAPRFASFYAAQKHASEKAIELYHSTFGLPAMIFRFFNVYGHGQDPTSPYSGVITVFTKLAREGTPLKLENGGKQTRDFVSVTEIAAALARALFVTDDQWDASPINLGSGVSTSVRTLAELIRKISNSRSEILNAPPRQGDVLHSLADVSRAREVLGFQTAIELSNGLSEMFTEPGAISA